MIAWLNTLLHWLTNNNTNDLLTGIMAAIAAKHTLVAVPLAGIVLFFLWPIIRYWIRRYAAWTPWTDDDKLADELDAKIKDGIQRQFGIHPAEAKDGSPD